VKAARYVFAVVVLDQLHDLSWQALAKGSCSLRVLSVLGIEQGGSEHVLHLLGHRSQVLDAGTPRSGAVSGSVRT
jgi:hypothetical protein